MELTEKNRVRFAVLIGDTGLSERGFAKLAELSHSTVNHLLTARRRGCSFTTAAKIERVLQQAPGELFAPETRREKDLVAELRQGRSATTRRGGPARSS